jgi:hypothetical protein
MFEEQTPVKMEREGGLGTLPGGGIVPLVLLSPRNAEHYCLGRIGWDMVCVLRTGMFYVVKHERQKSEVHEATMHMMASATKQTKMTTYQSPYFLVGTLNEQQYDGLT